MSKEVLTHSERYVRKTNRIILIVGITSFVVFLFGLLLLFSSGTTENEYQEPVFTEDDSAINFGEDRNPLLDTIEFTDVEEKDLPITTTPNPISMGQVVLGTDAKNVLTIGTNGTTPIRVVSVKLAEPPFEGFTFSDGCTSAELRGNQTCNVTMNWVPVTAGNVQNNFIVSWHEANVSAQNAKAPVEGKAVTKEECSSCSTVTGIPDAVQVIKDENGNIIGYITSDGKAVDLNGNEIGVVQGDVVVDENGNVIGRISANNDNVRVAYGPDGKVIGYVDKDGYVRDENGNIIGRVNDDGLIAR